MTEIPSKIRKLDNGEESWRKSSPDFLHLLRNMFKEKVYTDITIKVESGEKSKDIECHSLILMAHSPVLSALLSPRWKENENERMITLKDDDPDHFQNFVNWMYMDWNFEDNFTKIPDGMTPKTAINILFLAHKYLANYVFLHAEHLVFCYLHKRSPMQIAKMYTMLRAHNICQVDEKAKRLLRTIENCVLREGKNIFSSDAILLLNQPDLLAILPKFYLHCSEDLIYNGCIKWAKKQCNSQGLPVTGENIRDVLGDVIKAIRFPLLETLEITTTVRQSNILTQEEMIELLAYVLNKDLIPQEQNPIRFSCYPRTNGKLLRVNRLHVYAPNTFADFSNPHGFQLILSKTVNLCRLIFYCGPRSRNSVFFRVEIANKVFHKEMEGFSDEKNITIAIKPNVRIEAHVPTTIKFTITGCPTYYDAYEHTVGDTTKEISYWGQETIISKFNVSPHLANGLGQIPTLVFSAVIPEEFYWESDAD